MKKYFLIIPLMFLFILGVNASEYNNYNLAIPSNHSMYNIPSDKWELWLNMILDSYGAKQYDNLLVFVYVNDSWQQPSYGYDVRFDLLDFDGNLHLTSTSALRFFVESSNSVVKSRSINANTDTLQGSGFTTDGYFNIVRNYVFYAPSESTRYLVYADMNDSVVFDNYNPYSWSVFDNISITSNYGINNYISSSDTIFDLSILNSPFYYSGGSTYDKLNMNDKKGVIFYYSDWQNIEYKPETFYIQGQYNLCEASIERDNFLLSDYSIVPGSCSVYISYDSELFPDVFTKDITIATNTNPFSGIKFYNNAFVFYNQEATFIEDYFIEYDSSRLSYKYLDSNGHLVEPIDFIDDEGEEQTIEDVPPFEENLEVKSLFEYYDTLIEDLQDKAQEFWSYFTQFYNSLPLILRVFIMFMFVYGLVKVGIMLFVL